MDAPLMTDTTDAALAQAWAAGDERAYDAIVARFAPLIFGRCRRALGEADADDATQAVFLILARRREQAAASPVLAAWLMRVAGNVVRTAWRDRQRRRHAETSVPPPPPSATSEEPAMPDIQGDLDACLAELPRKEREAILLHHLAGRSLAEVSQQTGSGLSTVKYRLARGLERLRTLLAKRGVALSAIALAAALATEAQAAVPAEVIGHLRDLAHAGGGAGPTAVPSDRARRWSRPRSSTMTRIAIAAAGALLVGGAAWQFLTSAEAASSAHPPHLPARQPVPTPGVAAVSATAPPAASATARPTFWAILRVRDGASILRGIDRQSEAALLGGQSPLAELGSLRGAGFAIRIGFDAPPGLTDPAMPKERSIDFFGSLRCTAADAPLLNRLRAQANGTTPWLGMSADGPAWRYWSTSGLAHLKIVGDHADFTPPPALVVAPEVAAYAAGSPDQGLVADFSAMMGSFRTMHGDLRWADDGLRLHVENASAADAARAGVGATPATQLVAAPVLDRRLLDGVPGSAIWAAAVATRPGSGTVDPLATHALFYFTPAMRRNGGAWPPQALALKRWVERTDSTLLAWVEPGAPLPNVTLLVAMSQDDATAGLRDCGLTLGADGTASVPLGPVMLSLGWRDGALLMTTNPAGIDAVDRRGGFTNHPEVQHALAALPAQGITACTILRSAALLDTLSPYLAMIDPGISQPMLHDYHARLDKAEAFSLVSIGAVDGRCVIDARGSVVLAGCIGVAGHADQIARLFHIAN